MWLDWERERVRERERERERERKKNSDELTLNLTLLFSFIITIIIFALSIEQNKIEYRFRFQVSECSGNYDVPSIVNNQWNWNMTQSEWFSYQEWYSRTGRGDLDRNRQKSSFGYCLTGAIITSDDDTVDDQNGGHSSIGHIHTFCMTTDKLDQLDNLFVTDNLYPNGYFKELYDSIKYINYLSGVDAITATITFSGMGFLPMLLFNIWIETLIEIIFMDKTKKMALDTTYWSMLWPGCKIYSFPDIRNFTVFDYACSKFGLTSIFFAPTCFVIVFLILYGILLIFSASFNCCCFLSMIVVHL